MKTLKLFTFACIILAMAKISFFSVPAADNYLVLQGFAFDINSGGKAVIHSYDDRSPDVVIPQKLMGADVALIDDYAFFGDEAITSVSFGNAGKLKKIGVNAFCGCKGLRTLALPAWIEELSFGSFQNCTSLEELTIGEGVSDIPAQCFYGCAALESVTVPPSVTAIGDRAFTGCRLLRSVTIPDTVTEIADNAFDGCDAIVIYCTKDSCARHYAAENAIPYRVTDAQMYVFGDANGDGAVNINDVTVIQRHFAEIAPPEELCQTAADVDTDGALTISDATELQRYLAEYDVSAPIGEVMFA